MQLQKTALLVLCVLAGLLTCLLTATSLTAFQEGFIYGGDFDSEGFKLYRINVTTGEFEQLLDAYDSPADVVSLISNSQGSIDETNDLYYAVTLVVPQDILCYALESGKLVQRLDVNLEFTKGLQFNPLDGKLYCLENREDRSLGLTAIDPLTSEVTRYPSISRNVYPNDPGNIDFRRGEWGIANAKNELWITIDLYTGALVREVPIPDNLRAKAYDPVSGLVYGLLQAPQFESFYEFVSLDPENGNITKINTESLPSSGVVTQIAKIDPVNRRYLVGNMHNNIRVLDLQGNQLNIFEEDVVRSSQAWDYYSGWSGTVDTRRVEGVIVRDENNNCTQDNAEAGLARLTVELNPGDIRLVSDSNGRFGRDLLPGTYSAQLLNSFFWSVDCPEVEFTVPEQDEGSTPIAIELPLSPDRLIEQLDVSVTSQRMITGRAFTYFAQFTNSGTVPFYGSLQFSFDETLEFVSASVPPSQANVNTLEWELNNVAPGSVSTIQFNMLVPADPALRGLQLCAVLTARDSDAVALPGPYAADATCQIVLGSYDPNDISVAPRGFGERGLITAEDSTLAYTIRFQNIGDAPAFDVVILDTLDADLDINTLHFGAASHDYSVSILEKRILEFRFDDIQLPGKAQDEAGSQGVLKFKVDLKKDLPKGREIHNRAAIYFDFNAAVITNTVVNTIAEAATDIVEHEQLHDELELRSLADDIFVLHADRRLNGRLTVYSVLGNMVYQTELDNVAQTTIDMRTFPRGRYLLRVENGAENLVKSFLLWR